MPGSIRSLSVFLLALMFIGCGNEDSEVAKGDALHAGHDENPKDDGSWNNGGEGAGDGTNGGFAAEGDASRAGPPPPSPSSNVGVSSSTPSEPSVMPAMEESANPFVMAAHDPFSTFAADVDTASYDTFRQFVSGGDLPPASWTRVEDFVNFFHYDYPAPAADAEHPFAINLAAAVHPAGRKTDLLRVGIQGVLPPESAKRPANLVFLVDVSGSMSSSDKLPLVKVLLKNTLDVLEPTDKISLVAYASNTGVVLAPTLVAERAKIQTAIERLSAGGSTNGQGGIQLAYEQAKSGFLEGGINHVLLCTDGDFNVGISDPKELATFISGKRETGITMTAVGFGKSRSGDALMESLSNHGDGIYAVVYEEDQAIQYANERMLATLVRIAKDMKIQVEFNPENVLAYRLIGYENRAIADADFRNDVVDAGDIGAGHRVTALYEIVRVGRAVPMPAGAPNIDQGTPVAGTREVDASELVRVKVRYKSPQATISDPAREVAASLRPSDVRSLASEAGADFAWAAAMATLAEVLRKSPYASLAELEALSDTISAQSGKDGDRAELARLMPTVLELLRERR